LDELLLALHQRSQLLIELRGLLLRLTHLRAHRLDLAVDVAGDLRAARDRFSKRFDRTPGRRRRGADRRDDADHQEQLGGEFQVGLELAQALVQVCRNCKLVAYVDQVVVEMLRFALERGGVRLQAAQVRC
jgi:hypothetical protein